MAAPCFITWSGNAPTTVTATTGGTVMSGVATQTASGQPKTILQIAPLKKIRVVEWGYLFAAAPTSPVQVELLDTGTVFGTVTAGTVYNYNDVTGPSTQATISTATTGYNCTAEGASSSTRLLAQTYDLSTYFKQQFPLGREPEMNAGYCLRIRATPSTGAATTIIAYCIWEE